ncbi:hypothetical protein RSAG8_12057, partial [Rhizoctonia solani AG-8 WAC10335]
MADGLLQWSFHDEPSPSSDDAHSIHDKQSSDIIVHNSIQHRLLLSTWSFDGQPSKV